MKRGRPRTRYADNVKEESGLSLVQAHSITQDHAKWRSMKKEGSSKMSYPLLMMMMMPLEAKAKVTVKLIYDEAV